MENRVTETERLKEDIAYVRAATERSGEIPTPSIYLLWAAIALCGFALVDFVDDDRWVGRYWLVAGPAGFCLSAWLGWRANRRSGQLDRQTGRRWGLHWLAFMAAGALGNVLVATGQLTQSGMASLWVLLMALANFHAGVHLDRRMLPIGLILGAAYLATLWVTEYGWTAAGVVTAAAFTTQAYLGARSREPAS